MDTQDPAQEVATSSWIGSLLHLASGWGGWPEGRRMLWVGLLVLITAAGGMYYSISQVGKGGYRKRTIPKLTGAINSRTR
ncbi:hypothetical protein C3F00_034695 [Pseudomonas sp. MWU13-2860]|nr:hypothetical protein C3F00_034695 [Pseudomonas sp. MWU13-2860]